MGRVRTAGVGSGVVGKGFVKWGRYGSNWEWRGLVGTERVEFRKGAGRVGVWLELGYVGLGWVRMGRVGSSRVE